MTAASPFNRAEVAASPPGFVVNPRVMRAHLEQRPFWVLHYHDREDVFEGDPCRCGRHPNQDWLCRPAGRVRGIGLYTPDGRVHELGSLWADMTGKVFQLKMGVRTVVGGGTGLHLIGVIAGLDGQCFVYSWEYDLSHAGGHIVGPFADNVYAMQYAGLGALGLENLGLKL
jgi:hypothetical protein